MGENKDKGSFFFYVSLGGDFLFMVRKIIIRIVNRKEFSMKYKDWLDVWLKNYIKLTAKKGLTKGILRSWSNIL